jgi:hypothetical protein
MNFSKFICIFNRTNEIKKVHIAPIMIGYIITPDNQKQYKELMDLVATKAHKIEIFKNK